VRHAQDLIGDCGHVTVCIADHYGRLIGKTRLASDWPRLLVDGLDMPDFHLICGVEGRPLEGFSASGARHGFRNGRLVPDPEAAFLSPNEEATAIVVADAADIGGASVPEAPRSVLKVQIARLAAAGLAARIASELEFHLLAVPYAALAEGAGRLQPYYHRHGDNDVLVTSLFAPFCRDLARHLDAAGMPAEQIQGEGGRGQIEVNLSPAAPLMAADRHVAFKHIVKALAHQHGHAATFMSRLNADDVGSGGHIHLSLQDRDGKNALGNANGLTDRGCGFLAGILAFAPDLTLMHAPLANSYKRLVPRSFTPLAASWGHDNRTALVRLVKGSGGVRLEFRLPGADVNPYHAYAALIGAGLAGIDAGLVPGDEKRGAEEPADALGLPADLTEAIARFAASELARDAFGEDVHLHILTHARHELTATRRAVTDWEIIRGLERA